LERTIVNAIMRELRKLGLKPIKNHGSIYVQRAWPDIQVLVPIEGWPYAVQLCIEVKQEGGRVGVQQQKRLDSLNKQGAVAVICTDAASAVKHVEIIQDHARRSLKGK
jgi:hypothetical protein